MLEYPWVTSRVSSLSGDIDINSGPKSNALNRCFSICHWNLNSVSAHIFRIYGFSSIHFCPQIWHYLLLRNLSQSEIPSDDKNLEIPGYNLVRDDHSSNSRRGGVWVYCKSSFPFKVINVEYLQEGISFELRIGRKCCKFSCLYRYPSPTQDELKLSWRTLNWLQIKFMKTILLWLFP